MQSWKKIFTEPLACNNCGSNEYRELISRPDQQSIVECSHCGLAFLERVPTEENIHLLYSKEYYSNRIYGYIGHYYNERKKYMFIPRLDWVSRTALVGNEKKLLDIGCADGEFLEYAKKVGW